MKNTIKIYLTLMILLAPVIVSGQSIIDISTGTEMNVGTGADVCADMQTGNGLITGNGHFCGFPLPVELASFTSSVFNNNVHLSWTTSSEINNSGFDIERQDARHETQNEWIKIEFLNGNGNSNSPHNYSYEDRNLSSGKYKYRLKQTDFNGNFEYFSLSNEVNIGVPEKFSLSQNYPNPFNPSTNINFEIPFDGKVNLKIFDMSGKEISTLINDFKTAGYYSVNFNASGLSSGVYIYKITTEGNGNSENRGFVAAKKMLLIK